MGSRAFSLLAVFLYLHFCCSCFVFRAFRASVVWALILGFCPCSASCEWFVWLVFYPLNIYNYDY